MAVPVNQQIPELLRVLGWQFARPERHYRNLDDKGVHHFARINQNVVPSGGQNIATTHFPLVGKQDETFWNVLNLLSQDARVRNRTRIDRRRIRRELLNYCGEIYQNRQRINDDPDIQSRAQAFLNRVILPEQQWLVVSPMDGLVLETGTRGITMSNHIMINRFVYSA
jgi:hypothetical protein